MKLINQLNQIWYETDGDKIKMGLTRSFLDTLEECWHIIPAQRGRVREKAPLFTVETNESLVSVLSPVAGSFLTWNDRATNYPDKLSDMDVLIELTTKITPEPEEVPLAVLREERQQVMITANNFAVSQETRLAAAARYHELGTIILNREVNEPVPPRRATVRGNNPTMQWGDIAAVPAPRPRTFAQFTAGLDMNNDFGAVNAINNTPDR